MVRSYGRFKRLALSGIASAALGASLILPATALAYSPDSLSLGLAGNLQSSSQDVGNGALQIQGVKAGQDASQGAFSADPVINVAKPEVKSVAVNNVQGGDVHVSGNSPNVIVGNFQISDASANGNAVAVNHTGDANTVSGAVSVGGSSEQSNKQSADGNGQSGDAGSGVNGNVSVPIAGQISGDASGTSGALSAIVGLSGFDLSSWFAPSHSDSNHSQGTQSTANSGNLSNSGNSGKNSSSADNTSSATTGSATGSGSNTGPNTNQANTSGGAATSVAYGGNTGLNTANAIVAGGIAGNSLTVGVDASGNTTGTSGAVTNTGSVSSSAGATIDQSGTPINTVTQTNDPTQVTKGDQSNPQIAAALSNQHATSSSSNSNSSTVTVSPPPPPPSPPG